MNFIEDLVNGNITGTVVFLGIGGVGLLLLVIAVLLDGILDIFDLGGDGPFSLTTIAAFFSMFGFAGTIVLANGGNVGLASLIGALVGVGGGVGALFVTRSLQKSTSTTSLNSDSLPGIEASAILPIRPGSYGEIAFSSNGLRQTFAAVADIEIPVGSRVVIVNSLSGTSVKVKLLEPNENNQQPTEKETK